MVATYAKKYRQNTFKEKIKNVKNIFAFTFYPFVFSGITLIKSSLSR